MKSVIGPELQKSTAGLILKVVLEIYLPTPRFEKYFQIYRITLKENPSTYPAAGDLWATILWFLNAGLRFISMPLISRFGECWKNALSTGRWEIRRCYNRL